MDCPFRIPYCRPNRRFWADRCFKIFLLRIDTKASETRKSKAIGRQLEGECSHLSQRRATTSTRVNFQQKSEVKVNRDRKVWPDTYFRDYRRNSITAIILRTVKVRENVGNTRKILATGGGEGGVKPRIVQCSISRKGLSKLFSSRARGDNNGAFWMELEGKVRKKYPGGNSGWTPKVTGKVSW